MGGVDRGVKEKEAGTRRLRRGLCLSLLPVVALFATLMSCAGRDRKRLTGEVPGLTVSQLICVAQALMLYGELDGAASKLEDALEVDSENVLAMATLAKVCHQQGNMEKSKSLLDTAIKAAPGAPELYYLRAGLHSHYLDTASELADLDRAASLADHVPGYHCERAGGHAAAGHAKTAREAVSALARTGKWPVRTMIARADVASSCFDFDQYLVHTEELIASGRANARRYAGYALALLGRGPRVERERSLRKAIQLDPGNGEARLFLAMMLEKDGKLKEAAEHAAQAEKAGYPLDSATAKRLEIYR